MGSLSLLTSCVKYMLFLFNLAFVITGIILIAVGAAVAGEFAIYTPVLLDYGYSSVPALLIAIGAIIFIISFFGCCGAIKENYCMILTFSILMILVFILELAGGISGFVFRGRTYELLKASLNSTITNYDKIEVASVWDIMQRKFDCCGVTNMTDFEQLKPSLFPNGTLPMSCCEPIVGAIGVSTCNVTHAFGTGCLDFMSDLIRSHAGSLGAAGLIIGIAQGIGIVFACHLAKRTKYETS